MVDSPIQAAARFRRAAQRVDRENDRKVALAARFVAHVIEAGNPKDLRNARKRGNATTRGTPVALSVWITRGPLTGLSGSSRLIAGRGPWHLIEYDTTAHLIGLGRRKETLGKAIGSKRRGFLRFPGGDVRRGPVAHPGTKGKHGFENAAEKARPMVPRIIDGEVRRDLLASFGF